MIVDLFFQGPHNWDISGSGVSEVFRNLKIFQAMIPFFNIRISYCDVFNGQFFFLFFFVCRNLCFKRELFD